MSSPLWERSLFNIPSFLVSLMSCAGFMYGLNHQAKGPVHAWKWTNLISPNTRRNLGTFSLLEVSLSVMLVLKTRNLEILRWALITFLQFLVHKWEWQASPFTNPNVLLYVNMWFWYRLGSIFCRMAEMYHQHKSLRDYLLSLPSWENEVPMMACLQQYVSFFLDNDKQLN